jgi:hypothetical protein
MAYSLPHNEGEPAQNGSGLFLIDLFIKTNLPCVRRA